VQDMGGARRVDDQPLVGRLRLVVAFRHRGADAGLGDQFLLRVNRLISGDSAGQIRLSSSISPGVS